MKHELSILIPTYNSDCCQLVYRLNQLATAIPGLTYEIIVADDGSYNERLVKQYEQMNTWPNVSYIRRDTNSGRAAIRNFLAREACYEWLLFVDADMAIPHPNFLWNWLHIDIDQVGYGGYIVDKGQSSNLRFRYEKSCAAIHTTEERQKRPYQHFHTCNFLVRKDIMMSHPFDERFRHYGYEDVLFGKQLRKDHIQITHINNPVGFYKFDENKRFVSKTEEGLRTLHKFRNELRGYSHMLTFVDGIHLNIVLQTIRLFHRVLGSLEKKNLCSQSPSITIFKLYKLGYFLTLKDQSND